MSNWKYPVLLRNIKRFNTP